MNHNQARLRVQDHLEGILRQRSSLPSSPLRIYFDAFDALTEPVELPRFPMQAMNVIEAISGADICYYAEVDTETLQTSVVFDGSGAHVDRFVDAWARHVLDEPILSYWNWLQPRYVVRLSDFGSPGRIRELAIYEACLQPLGIEHHLLVPFMRISNRILSIGYGRADRDFSEDDRLALMLFCPYLALGRRYCEVQSLARAQAPIVHTDLSITRVEIVVVGRDARIRSMSARAARFIREHVGEFPRRSTRLPVRLEAWVLAASRVPPTLRVPFLSDDAALEVFAMNEADGISLYLYLDETLPNEQLAEALGTTTRQAEIGRLVCRGGTSKEIAAELGIAEGTVRTHIENLYERLDVAGRIEAIGVMCRRVAEYLRQRGDD